MADKELTVFVVEAGLDNGAYHYLYDVLAGKVLKGLKTDYVSVLAYNLSVTSNALEHTGKFRGINVLADFETPSYTQLQKVKSFLGKSEDPEQNLSDVFQSLIFSVSLFEKTKKKVFTRNIVVITSAKSAMDSYTPEKAGGIPNLIKELNIHLVVIGSQFGSQSKTEQNWFQIAQQFPQHHIMSTEEARKVSKLHPPVRKTRPMPIYRGELRLGADTAKLLHDKTYVAETDDLCLTFRVEVFSAAKLESVLLGGHDFLVEDGKAIKVERKADNFVWKKNFQGEREEHLENDEIDDKNFDKVSVEGKTLTPGFKFSNYDLIGLDEDLMSAAKLELSSEFDIFAFVPAESIPYAYFTGESFFVVPEKGSSLRNLLNHAAFAQALHDKGMAPLARFVRKQAKEVEVGPLFPVKVKMGDSFTFAYIFIRLPFKEDEKIGHFPSLKKASLTDEKEVRSEEESQPDVNKLMESFIEAKTYIGQDELDDTRDYKTTIDNFKVTLKHSEGSKLPLPPKAELEDPFLCSAPGANKFASYLRKIITRSLSEKDLDEFASDPDFIKEVLRENDSNFTNLFNMGNSLAVNSAVDSKWLAELLEKSNESSKRLLDALEVKYVRKADLKKQKSKKTNAILQARGNYGADEGDYGAVPDFDF